MPDAWLILNASAGNNPAIILPDINVTATVPHISGGLWFNAGQVCIAPRRLYIHADIFDAFVDALVETTKGATKEMTKIGPVQNELQFRKLVKILDDAKSAGHDMPTGGPLAESETGGFFLHPTIIKDASPESSIVSGEHFGTVAPTPLHSLFFHELMANRTHRDLRQIL